MKKANGSKDEKERIRKTKLYEAKKSYYVELIGIERKQREAIMVAYRSLVEDPNMNSFELNGCELTISELARLEGSILFERASVKTPSLISWRIPDENEDRAAFLQYESFLKQFPGVALPPRSKILDKWLTNRK